MTKGKFGEFEKSGSNHQNKIKKAIAISAFKCISIVVKIILRKCFSTHTASSKFFSHVLGGSLPNFSDIRLSQYDMGQHFISAN